MRFLCKIEDGYPGPHVNPYHCKAHAADVVRSLYVILTKGGVLKALWPKEGQGQGQGRVSHGGGGLNEAPSMDSSPQATMATSISSKGGGNSLSNNNNHNMARSSHEGLARFKLSDIHDLPLLSAIIAATIHDYEHKGFNVSKGSSFHMISIS